MSTVSTKFVCPRPSGLLLGADLGGRLQISLVGGNFNLGLLQMDISRLLAMLRERKQAGHNKKTDSLNLDS